MTDINILDNIIKGRRTVKPANFKEGSKVPDEVVNHALENAVWAPNHGGTQPWEFQVFTGESLKKLNEFESELFTIENPDLHFAKAESLKNRYKRVSHSIAICYRKNEFSKILEIEEVEAIACAVQNMALTISAYGYGGMWSTGGVVYYEKAKGFFNLGPQDKLLGFFLIGEILHEVPQSSRRPISEKVIWNK